MIRSTKKSRRLRNPIKTEDKIGPFFNKGSKEHLVAHSPQPFFQTKLQFGKAGDKYEKEADAVADLVTKNGSNGHSRHKPEKITPVQPGSLASAQMKTQRKAELENPSLQMQEMEEEEPVQAMEMEEEEPIQAMEAEEEEEVQMKPEPGLPTSSQELSNKLQNKSGEGMPIPKKTRREMENSMGADFEGVSIHTDADAVKMTRTLGAQAFTHGKDIYFNVGKFQPDTKKGRHLIAHELTHVVQQNGKTK